MKSCTADLHTHTVCSDGSLTPDEVVDLALKAGLSLIAVTDHDTTATCETLIKIAGEKGIKAVNGVEISAYDGPVKFHTLGYGLDLKKFEAFESKLYEGSLSRAEDIIGKLNALGVDITMQEVALKKFNLKTPIHGMHIARVMVEKGYVTKPDKFFKKYVAYGKPAYSRLSRPTPEEACEAIVSAGGLAVVAHPARIKMSQADLREKIKRLKDCGLSGIEARYATHTNEQTAYYEELADSLNLFVTGGSDTHGLDGKRVIGTPRFEPSAELLKRLKID